MLLSPSEGIELMSFHLRQADIMGDYPYKEEQKEYDKYNKEQKLIHGENSYKPWRRKNQPPKKSQDQINKESDEFIKQLIAKRKPDFNLMDEVDNFDPIANFEKSMNELAEKYKKEI